MMRNSSLSLVLGLTVSALALTPIAAEAAKFDYNRVKNISARPIASDNVLSFSGDINQNEGYVTFRSSDPNAPDAGHIGFRPGTGNSPYYVTGREDSPDPSGATRTVTLENVTGLSNFFNYLNSNNISLSSFAIKVSPNLHQSWGC
jgi:hypothetical protein